MAAPLAVHHRPEAAGRASGLAVALALGCSSQALLTSLDVSPRDRVPAGMGE
jgi:hypothetical protein